MGIYETIAYAVVAVETLRKESRKLTPTTLRGRMLHLMDLYSETEIYKLYETEYA